MTTQAQTNIAQVKVWRSEDRKDVRIYVRALDGRQGCLYNTGNRWHPAKSIEGNLTEADWAEARRLAVYDGKWHTVYESELHGKPVQYRNDGRCPDCGGYDCGTNCNANR